MKIIAFYLPQYHTFPENDAWWGKGFTEWTNVKGAKPSFRGHEQPRVPLNKNYYNLLDDNKTLRWQANIAKENGVYGFCYYHYWFDGHMLMQKPMENMLKDHSITLPFCICWANEDWTRAWAKRSREVLISQTYGDKKDWKAHFEYFLPFFRDERYIKIDGKPFLVLYRPEIIQPLEEMVSYWKKLAKEAGFPGLTLCYQKSTYDHTTQKTGHLFDYGIEYQPGKAMQAIVQKGGAIAVQKALNILVNQFHLPQSACSTIWYRYDDVWNEILRTVPKDEKMIPGAFVDWDNTPRYGTKSSFCRGVTPEKFQNYLEQQIVRAKEIYKKDMLFMFAWNEWGEGGYLEPDEGRQDRMLKAIRNALIHTGEFPEYPVV